MKKYKRIKKGFTLVELVVVIAVIAILAAVSVISYTSITKKARQSKDQQIITEANSALQRSEILKGKPSTAYDALVEAEEGGFKMQNIETATKSYKYAYVKSANRFVVLENNKIVYPEEGFDSIEDLDIWKFSTEQDNLNDGFSHYLKGEKTITTPISVTGGLDVGENTVSKVSYTRNGASQKATIRTNGGALEINGKNDDVYHYGYAESVNVIDIASSSYHENGEVKFLEVAAGHIDFGSNAEVSALHFTATGSGDDAKFGNDEKTISLDLSKISEEQYPAFSRDQVTIEENGTYVCEVKTESTEYIWLFGNGIKEQMVTTTIEGAIAEGGELKTGITAGAEDGSVAEQIANPAKRNQDGELVDNNGVVVDIDHAVIEEIASKEEIQTGVTLFTGGSGTVADPYLISSREEMENISNVEKYSNFKWVGPSLVDASNWSSSIYLCGSFDGNGVSFSNLDCFLFRAVWNGSESWEPGEDTSNVYTVKNLIVHANIISDGWTAAVVRCAGVANFVMDNVTVHGYVEGATGVASFVCFGSGNFDEDEEYPGNITFNNCNSDAIIYAKSGNAVGFVAHAMHTAGGQINLINSNYTGSMSAPSVSACKYVNGNWLNGSISDDQLSEKNNVIYKSSDNGWSYKAQGKTGTFRISNGTLPAHIGDAFVVTAESNATKATFSLVVSPNPKCMTSTYLTEEVDLAGGCFTSDQIKYFNVRVNASGVSSTGIHGNNFDIVANGYNGELGADSVVRVTQYSSGGSILAITNFYFGDRS